MVAFEIILLILSVVGTFYFIKKNDPPYIIMACIALALICLFALGFFN